MKHISIILALLLPVMAHADTVITQSANRVSVTPTVDTSALATGDVIHATAMTFAGACKAGNPFSIVQDVTITDIDGQAADVDLVLFNSAVSGYGAANAAFDPTDAQLASLQTVISLTVDAAFSDNGVTYVANLARLINCDSSGKVYGVLVSRGSPTYSSASSLTVSISFLHQ